MRVQSKVALRGLRHRERVAKLNAAAAPGIRVVPAKDEYRAVLKHPKGGSFPESGSAEWPDDRFTKRRLADGSVTREASEEGQQNRNNRQRQRTVERKHEHPDQRADNGERRQDEQRDQSRHRVEHHDKHEPNDAA